MKYLILSCCLTLLMAVGCKKETTLENEKAKLPAATQTGANTFGCLLNGKAWVAQNKDCALLCDPAFRMYYDPSHGGILSLISYIQDSKQNIDETLIVSFDSTNFNQNKNFSNSSDMALTFRNYKLTDSCGYITSNDSLTIASATIILSRYDLSNGIVSGSFEFTIHKPGCQPIIVTNGRFDKKL